MSIADRIKQSMGPSVFVPRAEMLTHITKEEQRRLSEQARAMGRARLLSRQAHTRSSRTPVGYETPERADRAPDGMEKEYLSHNKGHVRARVKAPMQLSDAANSRLAHEAAKREAELHGSKKPEEDLMPEPRYRLTRLDERFDADDGRVLRGAISQYVEDCIAIARRGGGGDSGKVDGASAPDGRIPFNEHQRSALGRLAAVHARISAYDREKLEAFAAMMAPIDGCQEPMSVSEFVTGIRGSPRSRRLEYAFVEIISKLAIQLYDIYRAKDFPPMIL